MEPNQKKKFVCKFCHKSYPCGKSLGGHIRTHMNNGNSAEAEGESAAKLNVDKIFNGRNSKKESSGLEAAAAQSSYGLRENPKRTKRFVDSNSPTLQQQDMVCKECGKGFSSLKALCGHMACHSDKEKIKTGFEDDCIENINITDHDVKQKLIMDSESDTETSTPNRPTRSKRMDYKTIGVYSSSFDLPNGSSSASGIEQEQEEVAICLMMLSRDSSGHKKGLNSFADSSDNNSVVLEAKSSSIDMRITVENGVNFVSNRNEFVQMKKPSIEVDVSDNSDSGYFRNGPKKVESDASVDGFIRSGEHNKSRVEYESGFEEFGRKLGQSLNKRSEFGIKVEDYGQVERPSRRFDSRKRAKNESSSPEMFNNSAQRGSKFECLTCNKVFHSHRSLWGHTASHSRINIYCESTNESGENSIETDSSPVPMPSSKITKSNSNGKNPIQQKLFGNVEKRSLEPKKSKGHECPFCSRVFKSGQALGGHKRSHFVGGADDRPVIIKQNLDEMPGVIDLNLPAPIDKEAIGNSGFLQW